MRFQDLDAIIDVLDAAYDEGIRTFMCTTHDRVGEICDHVRANPDALRATSPSIPCMPYAHKYANAVTEHGMLGALRRFLPEEGLLDAAIRGRRRRWRRKDIEGDRQLLIDAEMKMFAGPRDAGRSSCRTSSSTCCSGSGFNDAFRDLRRPRPRALRRRAGLHHDEPAALLDVLDAARHREPDRLRQHQQDRLPDVRRRRRLREGAARAPRSGRSRCRCFASGAIPPREAIEWVCGPKAPVDRLRRLLAGNIRQTKALIERPWGLSRPPRRALSPPQKRIGVVVIGRNEGERLRRCLASLAAAPARGLRRFRLDRWQRRGRAALGVEVVELDTPLPFTAARARNAGLERLIEAAPDWSWSSSSTATARSPGAGSNPPRGELARAAAAVVCGRRRERFPDASIVQPPLRPGVEHARRLRPKRAAATRSMRAQRVPSRWVVRRRPSSPARSRTCACGCGKGRLGGSCASTPR